MRKQIIKITLLIAIVWTCANCKTNYHKYVPVYDPKSTNERFAQIPDSLTPKHIAGIQKVLTYYGVPFYLKDGTVYYRGEIDQETLWNYSKKATDDQWLKTHN